MIITDELNAMLDNENQFIEGLKTDLAEYGDSLTPKAEHDLRMGYRTKAIVDIRLKRHMAGLNPVTGGAA